MRRLLPALIALLAPAALAAQTVRGTLADAATRAGIPGARILLVDANGRTVATSRTGDDGTFTVQAPAGGRFTVRAERPGYLASTSPAMTLGVGETAAAYLTSNRPILLEELPVVAGSRCEVRPGRGTRAAAVWEEARKALDATRDTGDFRFRVRGFTRDAVDGRGRFGNDTVAERIILADRPYVTVPAREIERHGFVVTRGDTIVYNLPDAEILLSDGFLDNHCFRVAPRSRAHRDEIGLAFEPVLGSDAPDVKGVLWLGLRPLHLRSLEYEYTNPPLTAGDGIPGGTLDFLALPNGRWIVSRWRLRMPLRVASAREIERALEMRAAVRRSRVTVRERGGEVVGVFTRTGAPVAMDGGATLAGVVWDSVAGLPLRGARVSLDGTHYEADTDSLGGYTLRYLPGGTFGVMVAAPRMDSLAYAPGPEPVVLRAGQTVALNFAIPPLSRLQARACGAAPEGTGGVSGIVRAAATGEPVAGARVQAAWGEGAARTQREARTTPAGVYHLCGVPAGVPVSLLATTDSGRGAAPELQLAAGTPVQRDLTVRDVRAELAAAPGVVALRVLAGGAGGGVGGARVSLEGTPHAALTEPDGTVALTGVAAGTYVLVIDPSDGNRYRRPLAVPAEGVAMRLALAGREGAVPLDSAVTPDAAGPTRLAGTGVQTLADRARSVLDLVVERFPVRRERERAGDRPVLCLGIRGTARGCLPVAVVLDGARRYGAAAAALLEQLSPDDVDGMEFLDPAQTARRYGSSPHSLGGAIVVRTRATGPRRP